MERWSAGALERVALRFGGGNGLLGETKPHRLDMAAGGILRGGRISEGDGFDEVLVRFGEDAGIGEIVVEPAFVEGEEPVPDRTPGLAQQGDAGQSDDGLVELEIGPDEGVVVPRPHRAGGPLQDRAQRAETLRRGGGLRGGVAGGEALQNGAEFGEAADLKGVHGSGRRNQPAQYAAKNKATRGRDLI